jgi:hypothetical protein
MGRSRDNPDPMPGSHILKIGISAQLPRAIESASGLMKNASCGITQLLSEITTKRGPFARTSLEQEQVLSWDTAILDSKREIEKARERINRLSRSIKIFEDKKKHGESFPDPGNVDPPKNI